MTKWRVDYGECETLPPHFMKGARQMTPGAAAMYINELEVRVDNYLRQIDALIDDRYFLNPPKSMPEESKSHKPQTVNLKGAARDDRTQEQTQ